MLHITIAYIIISIVVLAVHYV